MEHNIKKYITAVIVIAVVARIIPVISDAIDLGEEVGDAEQGLLNLVILLAVVGLLLYAVRHFFK